MEAREEDFAAASLSANELSSQLREGKISEAAFKEKMRELMLTDGLGRWWMVGVRSGEWYRFDGHQWVRDDPGEPLSAAALARDSLRKGRPVVAVGYFLALLCASLLAAFVAGELLDRASHVRMLVPAAALLVLLAGLALSFRIARRMWRGHSEDPSGKKG